ncbi:MAG: glycine--tRNA ligase subunit beta [Myxococcota bacterium]
MKELLFEVGAEEIPARLLDPAREQLRDLFTGGLEAEGLAFEDVRTWATPRRLALAARVQARQPDRREDVTGPPARVAFDEEGRPTRAAEGFAKKQGVAVEDLERRETPKGEYVGLTVDVPGRDAMEILPGVLDACIRRINWPRAMRWGAGRETFIRPVHWICAVLGGEVVPVTFAGIESGRTSRGHRFLAPEPFEVTGADAWVEALRARYVEPDPEARRQVVRDGAARLAESVGGRPWLDDALLREIAGLVEWPVPLLGTFEEEYLEIPAHVLTTSMTSHQRYVPIGDGAGGLTPHFVVVANTEAEEPEVVAAGNARVLRARLADARFFWEQDQKRSLEGFVPDLDGRTFLQGLGTMLDKARRLEGLAGAIADTLAPGDETARTHAARAGLLAKADLATDMVGEFADLQGEMGRDYARLSGEDDAVAEAVYEHYLPRQAGDDLPATVPGAAVALADRLDSLVGCFALGLEPTGSADPYALRRQALGVVRILEASDPAPSLRRALDLAHEAYGDQVDVDWEGVRPALLTFIRGRMKSALAQEFPSDLTEAVLEVGFEDPADVRARLVALQALKRTEGWDDLAAAVKRVAKIVGDHAPGDLERDDLEEDASKALFDAWREVHGEAEAAAEAGDYTAALDRMVSLKPAIDRFFEEVLVMSEDPDERERRLRLLARVDGLFHRIAAFDRVST